MKVFISWSGDLSNKLAEAFHTWLPGALQTVRPYFTPADIEKGARWSSDITKELESSNVGVLFITRVNMGSAWLLYEAGALSKHLEKSKVCPIVFGITHKDLPGPLRQFQSTEFKDEDFKKLLKTINSASGENKLGDSVLDEVFEMWWPRLKEQFQEILDAEEGQEEDVPLRKDREILEEILELSRLSSKRVLRIPEIPPQAMSDLVESLIATVNAIQGEIDPKAALNALSDMRKPVDYLLRHTRREAKINPREVAKKLEELSFEYQASDDDLDDEPPF